MPYLILLFFAIVPSIIWVLFYLRKDAHPESNAMVIKIFLYGFLSALPTVLLQIGFFEFAGSLPFYYFIVFLLNTFVGVALIEELAKYLVVKINVLKTPELDEPIDIMLYMIISGLGFASLENILKFMSPEIFNLDFAEAAKVAVFIFISSTFLHALASGIFGFFIAMGCYKIKRSFFYFSAGLFWAAILHGFYNLFIIKMNYPLNIIGPAAIIIGTAIYLSRALEKLKKIKSVCKIT